MLSFEIDFFYNEDSNFINRFKCLNEQKKYKINYISQNKIKIKNKNTTLIFFEEESFITSSEIFKEIMGIYAKKPASIIISNNPDAFNVVQWMRFGASDYLLQNNFNDEILNNSITGSLEFTSNGKALSDKASKKADIQSKAVEIPKNVNWGVLKDNENYEFTLLMFEIILKDDTKSRYSKATIENIYTSMVSEISKIAQQFSGKLWFWNNNSGAMIFYFGNNVDTAVLTAIKIFNNFFFLCVESLKLSEILDFKLVIHTGRGVYNSQRTDQITSDLINSTAHLLKIFSKTDTLIVTDTVYSKLNQRLAKYFKKTDNFEKRKIFQYVYYNY